MRRIPHPWLAVGFRRHKGVDLFDCGPVARTRLGKCAGVRPRFIRISSTFEPVACGSEMQPASLRCSKTEAFERSRSGYGVSSYATGVHSRRRNRGVDRPACGSNPFSLGRCIQPSHGCFLVPVREGLMVPDIRGRVAIICVVSVFLCVRALAQEAYYGGWPRSVAHGVVLKAQQKRRRRHLL